MAAPSPAQDYAPASGKVPVDELTPFCACLCCLTSLYTDFPDCIGCAGKRACLCCYSEFVSCKIPNDNEDIWCLWSQGKSHCGPVEVFCMQRSQVFCCDVRCSLPFTEDIPSLITCCFFTFLFKEQCGPFSFFATVKDLENDCAEFNSPPPPRPSAAAPAGGPAPMRPAASAGTQSLPQATLVTSGTQTTSSPMAPPVANE